MLPPDHGDSLPTLRNDGESQVSTENFAKIRLLLWPQPGLQVHPMALEFVEVRCRIEQNARRVRLAYLRGASGHSLKGRLVLPGDLRLWRLLQRPGQRRHPGGPRRWPRGERAGLAGLVPALAVGISRDSQPGLASGQASGLWPSNDCYELAFTN